MTQRDRTHVFNKRLTVVTTSEPDVDRTAVVSGRLTVTRGQPDETYVLDGQLIAGSVVGGLVVGSEGEAGSIYEGYTLSWGDDFNSLDVLRPLDSRGRWWPTRTYLAGPRGSDTLLGTMYDTDPFMTGHNDSNRGAAVGYSNMSVSDSVISLQARAATAGEQAHMSSTRNELGAMLSGAGAVHWYVGAAGTDDIIYEARIKFSTSNPAGWHPTMWTLSLNPTPIGSGDADETDYEGHSTGMLATHTTWTAGTGSGESGSGGTHNHDNTFHVISFVENTSSMVILRDGEEIEDNAWNCNTKSKPAYPLFSSHVFNGTFGGDTYSEAAWDGDANGATISIDWVRVWRRTGKTHYRPLVSFPDQNVVYGQSTVITLPAKAAIWGSTAPTEYLQVLYHEENEPSVTHTTVFSQFPTGVSYNSGTREITVNVTSGKGGRMNFVLSAWEAGGTGEPLRFAVNLSPVISMGDLTASVGVPVEIDLYELCDCGVLVPKILSVTGLGSSGLSFSPSTGLITGDPVEGAYSGVIVSCTNSVGQTTQKTITITVSAYEYALWTGPGWFDASDTSTVTLSGGTDVTGMTNKRSGGGNLTAAGVAGNIDLITNAQNGLPCLRVTRDVSPASDIARLSSLVTDEVSTMFQGDDKPYTVITVYKPTDTNTGFIWAASDTVNGTDVQRITLIRRNATASSVRRQLVTATPNDVSWGSGQASGTARIVAVKHSGTAVTVWDNSLTKAVDASAQDVNSFNSELIFRLFASEALGGSDPTYDATQCAMDFYECIIEDTAKADADITGAITDLAAKWGITLS